MSFSESQKINKTWMKILYGITSISALFITGTQVFRGTDNESPVAFVILLVVLMGVYFLVFQSVAEMRIDTQGISYKLTPFINSWKLIAWRDMQKVEIKKINALTDFGGWGIRFGWRKTGIILQGEHAITVTKKNGKEFAITTEKPLKVQAEIDLYFEKTNE